MSFNRCIHPNACRMAKECLEPRSCVICGDLGEVPRIDRSPFRETRGRFVDPCPGLCCKARIEKYGE